MVRQACAIALQLPENPENAKALQAAVDALPSNRTDAAQEAGVAEAGGEKEQAEGGSDGSAAFFGGAWKKACAAKGWCWLAAGPVAPDRSSIHIS